MEPPSNILEQIAINTRLVIDEHFTESYYPFTFQPEFSTLSSIFEISKQKPFFSFLPNDCIRNVSGFKAVTLFEE